MLDFESSRQRALDRISQCYTTEVVCRSERAPIEGYIEKWRVEVELIPSGELQILSLEVRLPYDFPLSLPRIFLSGEDAERLGPLPHVNAAGYVCTFDPETTTPNSEAPGEIVLACVGRAAEIIKAGLTGANHDDFEDEFLAYWGDASGGSSEVLGGISLIPEDGRLPEGVFYMKLTGRIGRFGHVLHAGGQPADDLRAYLKDRDVRFSEHAAFYAPHLPVAGPPFALTNGEVVDLIGAQGGGALKEFGRYVNQSAPEHRPIVVFAKRLAGRTVHQAWLHEVPQVNRNGFREGKLKPFQAMRTFERSRKVVRLYAEPFTADRLRRRTASDDLPAAPALSVLVAGLGSVGSHLTQFLRSGPVSSFHLLDPDDLTVGNVGRHVLGLSHVGTNKAIAMQRFMRDADPTAQVAVTADKSLAEAVEREPQTFEDVDCAFIAIGDTRSELWYDQAMQAGAVKTPTFFLWVEPYLAGGHCVYIDPSTGASLNDLFDAHLYRFNILSEEAYRTRSFEKREAGCQTTYVPYSSSSVVLFLSSLLPEILRVLREPRAPSCCMTWTGDLPALHRIGLPVSALAMEHHPCTLTTQPL